MRTTTKTENKTFISSLLETKNEPQELQNTANLLISLKDKQSISDLCLCASELSSKTATFAAIVGIGNTKEKELGFQVVSHSFQLLNQYFRDGDLRRAKLIIRFLSLLVTVNTLNEISFLNLIGQLLEVINDQETIQVKSDSFALIIMSSLLWSGEYLYSHKQVEIENIMNDLHSYMKAREKVEKRIVFGKCSISENDSLDLMWISLNSLLESKSFKIEGLDIPTKIITNLVSSGIKHDVNLTVNIPQDIHYIEIFSSFSLSQDKKTERCIFEEISDDLFWFLEVNYKECCNHIFTDPLSKDIPVEMWIAEIIISRVLQKHSLTPFLELLLNHLCDRSTIAFHHLPKVVGALYGNIEFLNPSCIFHFSMLLSSFINHYSMKWDWGTMSDCLQLETMHPKKQFVEMTLEYLTRYSYIERVNLSLPDNFKQLMKPKGIPNFSMKEDVLAKEVLSILLSRKTSESVRTMIESGMETSAAQTESQKIELLIQCILQAGSPFPSQLLSYLERYKDMIRNFVKNHESESLTIIHNFWESNTQFFLFTVDKMLSLRILSQEGVVNWLISESQIEQIFRNPNRELLLSTLDKLSHKSVEAIKKASQEQKKLDEMEKTADDHEIEKVKHRINILNNLNEKSQERKSALILNITQTLSQSLNQETHSSFWSKGVIGLLFHKFHEDILDLVDSLENLDQDYVQCELEFLKKHKQ